MSVPGRGDRAGVFKIFYFYPTPPAASLVAPAALPKKSVQLQHKQTGLEAGDAISNWIWK